MSGKRAPRSSLPTGTVTFLFTDIEGSSALWDQHPAAMRRALAEHFRFLSHAIRTHRGHVVKTLGDGVMAVFPNASDAVNACLVAQRHFQGQPAHEPLASDGAPAIALRIRMGLHTGEAEIRNDDYFGNALNVAARIMGVAQGDQVLLSAVTAEIVRSELPQGASLDMLGEHRLKGISHPVTLLLLIAPGLRSHFVASPGASTPKADTLPKPLTAFVGRESNISECLALLERARLLSLTALGGSGKTRLAIEVAERFRAAEPDSVHFVDLSPVATSARVAMTVAASLGVHEASSHSVVDALCAHLATRPMLLVLDNCEHVSKGCAALAVSLLARVSEIRILATSREPLGVPGEQVYAVPPLDVARPGGARAEASEAARLFIERARLADPRFAPTRDDLQRIEAICRRLEGIPLAIELAAARIKVLSLQDIEAKLASRFNLLKSHGGVETRHQTLQGVIEWSYGQLAPLEQHALRSLSVFAGGWVLAAAAAVTSPDEFEAIDLLERLVDKSLVIIDHTSERRVRYRMLETVREYAAEQLRQSGETEAAKERHFGYFLDLVKLRDLGGNSNFDEQVRRVSSEFDNVMAAYDWCDSQPTAAGEQLELAVPLGHFLRDRAQPRTARAVLGDALKRTLHTPASSRTQALRVHALLLIGDAAADLDDQRAANQYFSDALVIARELADEALVARALVKLGATLREMGDVENARRYVAESLSRAKAAEQPMDMARALIEMGEMFRMEQRFDDAGQCYEEAHELLKRNKLDWTVLLFNLAIVTTERKDFPRAREYLIGAVEQAKARQSDYYKCWIPHHGAALAAAMGDFPFAARMWGAAAAARSATGIALQRADIDFFEPRIERSKNGLGEATFAASYEAGRALSLDEAATEMEDWLVRARAL